jgi:phosphoglucomutase
MRVKCVVPYWTEAPIGRCSALLHDVLHAIKTADHDSTNIDLGLASDRTNARTTASGGHTLLIGNGDSSAIAGQAAIEFRNSGASATALSRSRAVSAGPKHVLCIVGECNPARQKERLWLSH